MPLVFDIPPPHAAAALDLSYILAACVGSQFSQKAFLQVTGASQRQSFGPVVPVLVEQLFLLITKLLVCEAVFLDSLPKLLQQIRKKLRRRLLCHFSIRHTDGGEGSIRRSGW